MSVAKRLSGYAKNGVLSLKFLRRQNYPLFKYAIKNLERVRESLKEFEVEVLNDLKGVRSPEKIRLYMKYHFGTNVNLSEMRKNHYKEYVYLVGLGYPRDVVESFGLKVVLNNHVIDFKEYLIDAGVVDEKGSVSFPLPRPVYNKLYYKARQKGITVEEFIEELGFSISTPRRIETVGGDDDGIC